MFLIEPNCSFPFSKIERNCVMPLYLVFKMWMGTLFPSHEYTKEPNKITKKHGNEKISLCWKDLFFVDKGRFKHILNIFQQKPGQCPLIHPSSSTCRAGSCCIQKGGLAVFPQWPTFLGYTGLSKVNGDFQRPMQLQHLHKSFTRTSWQESNYNEG